MFGFNTFYIIFIIFVTNVDSSIKFRHKKKGTLSGADRLKTYSAKEHRYGALLLLCIFIQTPVNKENRASKFKCLNILN